MTKKNKFIGRTLELYLEDHTITAKIVSAEFHNELGPLFHLVSTWGNRFTMTRRELMYYASPNYN